MTDTNKLNLSTEQIQALAAAMLSVARIDGVHPAEEALIASFHQEHLGSTASDLNALLPLVEGEQPLAKLAADQEFAETLVRMCVMTGYADGHLSEPEWSHIQTLAQRSQVSSTRAQEIRTEVKDLLVAALSHLPDPESVANVAKTL